MFQDKFGLTAAILNKTKNQTRRICKKIPFSDPTLIKNVYDHYPNDEEVDFDRLLSISPYKLGEVIAIAQSYEEIYYSIPEASRDKNIEQLVNTQGWHNKMFIRTDLMPHRIKITNIRIEHLQDISDEDCKAEGIDYCGGYSENYYLGYGVKVNHSWKKLGNSPKEAYANLIDKISGLGTWENNPYVYVYDFELIK